MLLRLVRPDEGDVRLFGSSPAGKHKSVLHKVGSLIESPSLYPHLTGRENMELTRRLLAVRRECIEQAHHRRHRRRHYRLLGDDAA